MSGVLGIHSIALSVRDNDNEHEAGIERKTKQSKSRERGERRVSAEAASAAASREGSAVSGSRLYGRCAHVDRKGGLMGRGCVLLGVSHSPTVIDHGTSTLGVRYNSQAPIRRIDDDNDYNVLLEILLRSAHYTLHGCMLAQNAIHFPLRLLGSTQKLHYSPDSVYPLEILVRTEIKLRSTSNSKNIK
ncbi:hypothetical protein KQX54_021419 [Cotesia glomerata]|uniref:Uncharacterized protein n=1 Tax=Cotesia glomerata TaxID=32391 RepID=A0AAV7IV40_COTGL|nr:hypothetical protein KQX54_021419 [Cotesia glomerata]